MAQTVANRQLRAKRREDRIKAEQTQAQAYNLARIANAISVSTLSKLPGTPINVIHGCRAGGSFPVPGSRQTFHFVKDKKATNGIAPTPVTISRAVSAEIAKVIRNAERRRQAGRWTGGPEFA